MSEADLENLSNNKLQRNLAFFAMVVGMFMAILDIQIVVSSLPVIGAGLSATQDELSWVQTSYIIAEVVIIPLTGFLAKLLSTRISYSIASFGFTIMSICCAFANNLESMIICRALQGFFGGAMIPTVFGIVYIIFEEKERPSVIITIGLTVTLAPTLGPSLGGFISETLSWHYMFLLNVIPGLAVTYIVYNYANFDKPNYSLLKNFDYIGVFFLITSLASIQYVLEEGSRKDWFENNEILTFSIYAAVGLIFLIYHEFTTTKPVLDLKAFKNKNFAIGCVLSGILGVGLYCSIFLLPIFLGSNFVGITTIQIGTIMAVMGVSQFIASPIAGKLMSMNVDRRYMLLFGFVVYSYGCYLNSFMTVDTRFDELLLPQFVRGFAVMFCFIPINDLTLGSLSKTQVQDASGLYNLMRNLGGAIGLAIVNSKLTDNMMIHRDTLSSSINATNQNVQFNIEMIENLFSNRLANPEIANMMIMNSNIIRDSFIISVNNMFVYLGLILIIGSSLIFFMKDTVKK